MASRYKYNWDQVLSLNADYLAKKGVFSGFAGRLIFDDPQITASYFYHDPDDERCEFHYCWNSEQGSSRKVVSSFSLRRRRCRLGGFRTYITCPHCGEAKLRLAILDSGLRCGPCGDIRYRTQSMTETARMVHRANKIARRDLRMRYLGDIIMRPTGMHAETYARLLQEFVPLREEIVNRMATRAMQAKGSAGSTGAWVEAAKAGI